MVAEYNKVIAYRRATWTLAAYFRTGYLYETFSKALLGAPARPKSSRVRAPRRATSTAIRSNRRSRALMRRR